MTGSRCAGFALAASVCMLGAVFTTEADATIEGMAAAEEVSYSSYYDFMDLWLYTHTGDNKGPSGPQLVPCRDNIATLMESYGLDVTLEPFTYSGGTYHNVVGTQVGTLYPNQEYVIGAHYDTVSNPGADDNASGVALVLECARIISQYDSAYTIRYVAFSMEEVGLVGSEAYVAAHAADDILGMVSADMVAYDPGTNNVNVYGRTDSNPIKNALAAAVTEYGDGVTPLIGGDTPYSDHAPFEAQGLQACLLIEGAVWDNPYYHQQSDNFENPDNLNFDYAVKLTRSAVGWLVDAAEVDIPVNAVSIGFPSGQPEYIAPLGGTMLQVQLAGVGTEVPAVDSAMLYYQVAGRAWQSESMTSLGGDLYEVEMPGGECGRTLQWYVAADSESGSTYTEPRNAPDSFYESTIADGVVDLFADNFETDHGWVSINLGASSGDWQRGTPVNDPGWAYDPESDYDGSGQCMLTQNETGNTDVDGGAVQLVSPSFDLSGGGSITYAYFLRLTESAGADKLLVEISSNGDSGPWTIIAEHDTDGGLSWRTNVITAGDLETANVTLSTDMRIRFTANDDNSTPSIVEAGVDAFRISTLDCPDIPNCPWDVANPPDNTVNLDDLLALLANWGDCPGQPNDCPWDIAEPEDDIVNLDDLLALLANWGPCP